MKKSRRIALEHWNRNVLDEGGYEALMGNDNSPKLLPDQDIASPPEDRPHPLLEGDPHYRNNILIESGREDRVERLARRLMAGG